MTALSRQAAACEAVVRVFAGGMKPSAREKEYLADQMREAAGSLRFISDHDTEFREFIRLKREGKPS